MNTDLKTHILQLAARHPHMRLHSLVNEIRKWEVRQRLQAEENYNRQLAHIVAVQQSNIAARYNKVAQPPKRPGWLQRFAELF